MPFYDAGDAAIFYEIHGNGPPLILLHGYALNSVMWELNVPVLSGHFKVITVDLRGFGQSSCGKEWSGSAMADDVIGLIRELELEDVTVTGFSLSGGSAVRTAYELPYVVIKMVLVSSILPSRGKPRPKKEEEYQAKEESILRLRGVEAWADAIGLRKGKLVDNIFKRNPDARPVWDKIIARHNPDYLLQMMQARKTSQSLIDWRSKLKDIKQKTLLVFGAQDKQFIDGAYHLDMAMPDTRLIIIKGAGHMVNLEKPEEFNNKIIEFLTRG
ncbi:MAG: alpha/beta hydrolase [Candidatus Zixiibacteriota bacterium]|nr:MAG: alpha/beta hydrolase [candidate division Zixibacteria bacterium]